jgi:predicted short-subunit dehydrogenase-like oxidoreductase (DUF2520 family)
VAANLGRVGAAGVLTGPIVRGDARVVARHLELLADEPRTLETYRALGRLALERARQAGLGDRAGQSVIETILRGTRRG